MIKHLNLIKSLSFAAQISKYSTMVDSTNNLSWQYGLVRDMKIEKNVIMSSEYGIVMKDKYPKAQHHYLVLPRENIPSIFDLNKSHIPLLQELYALALQLIRKIECNLETFKIGFHAEPSLQHLHMHVISTDFQSHGLKTTKHWNSFNTVLFIPYEDLLKRLNENGKIEMLSREVYAKFNSTELKCHQCDAVAFQNIKELKEHLGKCRTS